MSVLACDRRGCDNTMCNRLSHDYGYICNDCYEELEELSRCDQLTRKEIKEFMSSSKDESSKVVRISDEFTIS